MTGNVTISLSRANDSIRRMMSDDRFPQFRQYLKSLGCAHGARGCRVEGGGGEYVLSEVEGFIKDHGLDHV